MRAKVLKNNIMNISKHIGKLKVKCLEIPHYAYTWPLAVIGPGQICVPKSGRHITNKNFPRGQVNGFVDTWTLKKIKTRDS